MNRLIELVRNHWGIIVLSIILFVIIALNVNPGTVVLGNDNFSPELDPTLTFERQVFSPAWRTHRVLGIPSDTEQADIFRSGLFVVLEKVLPVWVVSQGYLFFTFFIASFSMGHIVMYFVGKIRREEHNQTAFFIGGLTYLCSMLTTWIYFFPVHLFVAAYAFLPFVMWRFIAYVNKQSVGNSIWLLAASCLIATSALTATMFLVESIVLCGFALYFFLEKRKLFDAKKSALMVGGGLCIIFGIQLFWALPFLSYVQSNTAALRESAINRDITASTIENEARHNTAFNTIRYFASWMDTKENTTTFTFTYRDWYKNSVVATLLSYIPVILGILGAAWLVLNAHKRRIKSILIIPFLALLGWTVINGINPPFGFMYAFVQEHFPTVAQIFRWQSSKMWPLLALSMPILATLGFLWIRSLLEGESAAESLIVKRPEHFHLTPTRKMGVYSFLAVVVVGLLVYVYPYFKGDLVRDHVFVQVPSEYAELADYLKKTDSTSRIFVSPEANTLYFRNYSWGFWGSVVLNYIVPNPIIEKALVIGSYENEQAYNVITNAYFSENPRNFTNSLIRYNTSYILSDKYSSQGDVGYPYDWELHTKVIEENPDFRVVWKKGKLTLYQIINYPKISSAKPVYSYTDVTKLNRMGTLDSEYNAYFTNDLVAGTLYPFALKFDNFEYVSEGILATTIYKGPATSYTFSRSAIDTASSPTKVVYSSDTNTISLAPVVPVISVNKAAYTYVLPERTFVAKQSGPFVTLGDEVLDIRYLPKSKTTSTVYNTISDTAVKIWQSAFSPINIMTERAGQKLLNCQQDQEASKLSVAPRGITKCDTPPLQLSKDTVVEAEIRVRSTAPGQVLICVESANKKTCLNKNSSMFVDGVSEVKTLLPLVVTGNDSLRVFLDFKNNGGEVLQMTVEKLSLNLYEENEIAKYTTEIPVLDSQLFTVGLKDGDTLGLTIPILDGPNSSPMRSDGVLIPETSTSPFEAGKPYESVVAISPQKGLEITNIESNSSVYPKLTSIDPRGGIGMVFVDANHISGIPLDLSLRDVNKPHRVWTTKLPYKKDMKQLELFLLPEQVQSYYLEAFSTALGPRPSTTIIQGLFFQIIPQSWYTLALQPISSRPVVVKRLEQIGKRDTNTYSGEIMLPARGGNLKTIVTIPTAISKNWKLVVENKTQNDRVVVNGWQQGWMVGDFGRAEVTFGPSSLVYIGFGPLILIVLWIILQVIRKMGKPNHG